MRKKAEKIVEEVIHGARQYCLRVNAKQVVDQVLKGVEEHIKVGDKLSDCTFHFLPFLNILGIFNVTCNKIPFIINTKQTGSPKVLHIFVKIKKNPYDQPI